MAPQIEVTDLETLPTPSTESYYGLRRLDILEISVRQDESLNGTYTIDTDGNLEFPYLGSVSAAGLLPGQLADRIEGALSPRFVLDPDVIVRSTVDRHPTLSIGGQVNKPGNFPVDSTTTLMRAINTAGGTTKYAQLDDVLVFREVGSEQYIGVYNIGAIQRGNYQDPALYPNDIVMVGDSPARRRLETILQLLPALATASVLIDRATN
ncbi:polysaccharide biosynthesis/export family protein [Alteriqipengyuania lutimaris]|nr:polysaccharide biosynthesis/export family protein [Alteriqipengyuania lutimaris]MBB3034372.1 polysaccharide export outer membrane protein [Alteriqipengyuania lutimaris]